MAKITDKKKKCPKWIRLTALIACICFIAVVLLFFTIQIYVVGSTNAYILNNNSQALVSDAVMILGAYVYRSGYPSYVLRERLDNGYEIYSQGLARKIIVSGDHGQADYDEVNAMRNYLIEKGVPSEDIFMDHAGFNTYDSMYRARDVFLVETLIISTQEFHINRAVYIARCLGIDAYGLPTQDRPEFNMFTQKTREKFARIKAVLDVLINRSPRFLGETIPITGDGNLTGDNVDKP